jgi:hypothetical protein
MSDLKALTIEVLGGSNGAHPAVLDRVIGGTVYLDEAKRIGRRLLEITDGDVVPQGFRILSSDRQVLYEWRVGDDEA